MCECRGSRKVQFTALPKRARKHGLRPVIRHVMRTAAYMARSARRLCARLRQGELPARLGVRGDGVPGGGARAAVRRHPDRTLLLDAALRRGCAPPDMGQIYRTSLRGHNRGNGQGSTGAMEQATFSELKHDSKKRRTGAKFSGED